MRNKKWLKSITAVAMSVVLLVTTVPIVLAVDDTPQKYNPSPIFDDAAREQGAAAWLDEDGNVRVEFPSAEGASTYQGYKNKTDEKKDIASYVLQLYDLGGKLTAYEVDPNPLTISIDAAHAAVGMSTDNIISAMFPKEKVDEKGIDLTNRRYSVTITAVDEDGWLSQELYTYVSDVPIFSLTDEEMMPMTAHENAMREMMCFEEKKTDQQSDNGVDKAMDYKESGGSVSVKGKAEQAGAMNAAANITTDTSAYRILITGKPGANGQSVDTAWSRQTYDYTGAKEIWFWMDLSQVDMQGISFRLRPNQKQWRNYGGKDGSGVSLEDSEADEYGTVYSTVGAATSGGKNPYVYVQQDDGSWKTVNMTNGTIDLSHFTGYVRVPIEFFCSETDTFVQLSNDDMNYVLPLQQKGTLIKSIDKDKVNAWMETFYCKDASGNVIDVLVDEAGTPISEALLLQRRGTHFHKRTNSDWYNASWMKTGLQGSENKNTDGYMLAPGRSTGDITSGYPNAADVEKQADGTYAVVNRETGYKAIEDVMAAGFAYTGISDDSVEKSVYIDNIMFYRDDGLQYPTNTLGNTPSQGVPVSNYFNQKEAIQEAIFNTIDKYIGTPNYSDYRAVKYVANLINNYKRVYKASGQYNETGGFLEYNKNTNDAANYGTGALADAAANLGRSVAWQKYLDARKACVDEGTIQLMTVGDDPFVIKNINNSAVNDLIPEMIKSMEKLPDPESVTQVSDALRTEIVKLYRIYTRLNLGQLTLLGKEEEDRLIQYFNLVVNAIGGGFVTGKQLANMPFITFNNFEENTNIGDRAYQLENCLNINGDADFRRTKGIVTYSITDGSAFTAVGNGILYNPNPQNRPNATWAYITNQGFKNTKGATVSIDADWTGGTETGTWHTITVAKKSQDAANLDDRKTKNMAAENLGGLAAMDTGKLVKMDEGVMPVSLVFYVDFTNLSNFKFGVNVFSVNSDGTHIKLRPDMGANAATDKEKKLWRAYYMMDPATGEWVRVQNDNQWSYSSNSTDGDTKISLDGYKGYIAIPLQHFKWDKPFDLGDISNQKARLDYDKTILENIYAVQFGIAGDASIDESTYTIDNIGFTYDKAKYDSLGLTTGQEVTTYAEMFGAKSDAAEQFEEAVATIDQYDTANLSAAITAAENMYNDLGDYQKTLQSVIQAKALLDSYKDGSYFTAHPKSDMNVASLTAAINSLPSKAKASSTSGSYDLPYPGYNADGSVNYAEYGFNNKEEAENAVKLYEEHYKRMSKADTGTIDAATKTALINSYSAARRCLSLEDMKAHTNIFLGGLSGLYTATTKDGSQTKYTSIATRDDVDKKWEEIYYKNMPYFAKSILASGGMGDALQVLKNANLGIPRFLRNCQATALKLEGTVLSDGTSETKGGIDKLLAKYTGIYNEAKAKIDAKSLFTEAELQTITDAIGEYDSLLQAYHDVKELYDVIADIKALFPVHDVSVDKETVTYTKENYTSPQTVKYTVNYTEAYPIPTADNELNKIRVTFTNGVLTNALNEEEQYKVEFSLNGTTCSYTSEYLKNHPVQTLPNLKVDNNKKQELEIKLYIENPDGAAPTAANEVTETLKIELLDKNGNVVQSRSGAADEATGWNALEDVPTKTITFTYAADDAYTITIPAEVNIPWGSTEPQKLGFGVEANLASGSKIVVSVSGDSEKTLKVSGYDYALSYSDNFLMCKPTFTGNVSKTREEMNAATDSLACPYITVNDTGTESWDSVPIGEYGTTLTYTVNYTKGTATP